MQCFRTQGPQPKALSIAFLIHLEWYIGGEMLASNEGFDDCSDETLFMDINEGFEGNFIGEGLEIEKYYRVRRGTEHSCFVID